MEIKQRHEQIWKEFEDAQKYKQKIRLEDTIKECVNFYEGNQWPAPTEKTKLLPRPVINVIKQICKQKESSILSSIVKTHFSCAKHPSGCPELNSFIGHIEHNLKQKSLDKKAVRDGVRKGGYFYHYFWDNSAKEFSTEQGAVNGEVIDPLNIFFSNPLETDEQKQDWIIIATRTEIEKAKLLTDNKSWAQLIEPDEENKYYETERQESDKKLCTVLTRYSRKNGEVVFEKSTKTTMLVEKTPIDPHIYSDTVGVLATLYPVAVGQYEEREKCIYGISEVEPLIQNQKAINFMFAMQILNVQNNAWGKYSVLPGALKNQKITNEPGQTLIDFTNSGSGIRRIEEPAFSTFPLNLTENLISATKDVTGANSVITGDNFPSNASGVAIAQLQSQALKPIESQRQQFWQVREKCALILAQFCKTHYGKGLYSYVEEVNKAGQTSEETKMFDGSKYLNEDIEVTAEAGQGTQFSEILLIQNLQDMMSKGIITPEEYIKLAPDTYFTNKQEILDLIQNRQASEMEIMQMRVQELENQNKQLSAYLQSITPAIQGASSLINKNDQLEKQLAALVAEYTNKINAQNAAINQNAALAENIMRNSADHNKFNN